jgi:N-acetylneuraminic acid mutarotase
LAPAVGVVSGTLYAIGGQNHGALYTVEAYDPLTNSWSTKTPMPNRRLLLAAGVIHGHLYEVGGLQEGEWNTVAAYDPTTNAWTVKAPMPTARAELAAGVVNGVLYAVGGEDSNRNTVNIVEAFKPN